MAEAKEIGIVRRIGIAMRYIAENGGVGKDLKIPAGGKTYAARGIDGVMDKVCGALIAAELAVCQKYTVTRSEYREKQQVVELVGEFEIHSPCGASLSYRTVGMGVDFSDKAFQKAQTGAYKYFLAQALAIPYSGLQFENEAENQPIAPPPPAPKEKPAYEIKPDVKKKWRESIAEGNHTANGIISSLEKRFTLTDKQRDEIYTIEVNLVGEIAQRNLNSGVPHDDIIAGFKNRLGDYFTDDLEAMIHSLNPVSE